MKELAIVCLTLSVILEPMSYYRQIRKTIKTKKSHQISSTSFMYRILKHILSCIGLVVYLNYVGALVQFLGLICCIGAFIVVIKHKPKGWSLF